MLTSASSGTVGFAFGLCWVRLAAGISAHSEGHGDDKERGERGEEAHTRQFSDGGMVSDRGWGEVEGQCVLEVDYR